MRNIKGEMTEEKYGILSSASHFGMEGWYSSKFCEGVIVCTISLWGTGAHEKLNENGKQGEDEKTRRGGREEDVRRNGGWVKKRSGELERGEGEEERRGSKEKGR